MSEKSPHADHHRAQMELYGDLPAYREGYEASEKSLRKGEPYKNPYRYGTPEYTAYLAGYNACWREYSAALDDHLADQWS